MASTETASDPSIDRLLARLAEAHDADVDALVARYRAGTLALTALVTQAHDIIAQNADAALDDIGPDTRGGQHVMLYGLTLAALGGLAVLAGKPDTVPDVGETSTMFALHAAAAEYSGDVSETVIAEARRGLEDRIQTVADALDAGDISEAQAAAYVETILANDAWLTYGTEQNQQATDAGESLAWWETDSPKSGSCSDCQAREDASPYAIDELPGIPGDGSTDCGPGCLCSVRYSHETDADKIAAQAIRKYKATFLQRASCATCGRWVGRKLNPDAIVYCPVCKETPVTERRKA